MHGGDGVDGAKVRARRVAQAMTQTALARASGLSQESVSRIETGRIRVVQPETVAALARALDVSPAELFEREAAGEADDDATMVSVSAVFDPRRGHLLCDANLVVAVLSEVDPRVVPPGDATRVARAWLDVCAGLRREGVAVTAQNLAARLTVSGVEAGPRAGRGG
ncbi:MAG: helix-turn-helix transcriptional regulator [Myxococcales bacterium]|nr:helix-turn-helix transcriptional regulator [Myxococcales bacterium]